MNNPWACQIELTEGCTRACDFCGIHGVHKTKGKKISFMKFDLASAIADDFADWVPKFRLEFAMCGEPLLNPDALAIVKYFRETLPRVQLTISTNSDPIRDEEKLDLGDVVDLFDAGLNTLMIDCYDGEKQYREYAKQLSEAKISWFDYYDKDGANRVYSYRGAKHRSVVLTPDLSEASGTDRTRVICNHCGNVDFELAKKYGVKKITEPLKLRCTKPFREISIKHDGVVCGCCIDHCRELVMGKFPEEGLHDIWFGRRYTLFRQLLYDKDRNIIPCSRCDYDGGFRHGLLHNPKLNISQKDIMNELEAGNKYQKYNYKK